MKKKNNNYYRLFFNEQNLNYIKEFLEKKNKLALFQDISKVEKEENEFLLNYDGRELEPEWNWVRNISIVYIINENDDKILNELKFSLRSIEKYIPWFFGIIYIVVKDITYNLFWLNTKNRHIRIINSKDIVPKYFYGKYIKKDIEMYLDKIPSISERFLLLYPNHYFKHFIHPRFFFNLDFFPKYNFVNEFEEKQRNFEEENESIIETYERIKEVFGINYINSYRFLVDSPIPLYRDLFKPVRQLYLPKILQNKRQSFFIQPLYLLSTYNIYGASQIYFPNYVAGFGEIRKSRKISLNKNRTILYYGFDITSEYILKKTIININLFEDIEKHLRDLEKSNVLFFCVKLKNAFNNYELKIINNYFLNIFSKKSFYEV